MIPLKQISYNNSNKITFGQANNIDDEKKFRSHKMPVLDNLRLRGGAGKSSCTSIVPQTSICRQIVFTPGGSYGYQCQPFLMCGPQMPFQSCPPIVFNISSCPKHASSPCCLEKTGSKVGLRKRKSSKRSSRSPKGSKKHMQTSSSHSKSSQISGASSASQGSKEIINSKEQKTAPYLFDTQSTQYNSMESIHGANNSKTTQHKLFESAHGAKPGYRSLTVEPINELKTPPEQTKQIHYRFPRDSQHEYTAEYPSGRYSAPPAFGRSLAEPVTYPPFTSFQGAFHQTEHGNEYDRSFPENKMKKAPSDLPSFINPELPGYQPDRKPKISPDIRVDLFGAKERSPETPKQATPPNLTTKGNVSRSSPIQSSVQTAASPFVSPGSPQCHSSKIHESESHNFPAFPKQPSTDQSPKFVSLESGSVLSQSSSGRATSQKTSAQLSEQASDATTQERSASANKIPSEDTSQKYFSPDETDTYVFPDPSLTTQLLHLVDLNEKFEIEAKAIMDGLIAFQEERRNALL